MNYVKEINENVLNLIVDRQQQKAAVEGQLRCKLNSNGQKKSKFWAGSVEYLALKDQARDFLNVFRFL